MSAPPSACWPSANPSRTVQTRPPTRSRASTTVTAAPRAVRSRAAARPASPAPATRTDAPPREPDIPPSYVGPGPLGRAAQKNAWEIPCKIADPAPAAGDSAVSAGCVAEANPARGPLSVALDVGVDLAFEELDRHSARAEHDVVELADREALTEGAARLLAQFDKFQLAQHVGAGLTGHHHVSLDFAGANAIVDGLLPRPALGVQSRVDYQPPCAEER